MDLELGADVIGIHYLDETPYIIEGVFAGYEYVGEADEVEARFLILVDGEVPVRSRMAFSSEEAAIEYLKRQGL